MDKTEQGTIIEVKIKPNSGKFGIINENGKITIKTKNKPEKGRANLEIINEITKLTKSETRIIKGLTSSKKTLLIKAEKEQLKELGL